MLVIWDYYRNIEESFLEILNKSFLELTGKVCINVTTNRVWFCIHVCVCRVFVQFYLHVCVACIRTILSLFMCGWIVACPSILRWSCLELVPLVSFSKHTSSSVKSTELPRLTIKLSFTNLAIHFYDNIYQEWYECRLLWIYKYNSL